MKSAIPIRKAMLTITCVLSTPSWGAWSLPSNRASRLYFWHSETTLQTQQHIPAAPGMCFLSGENYRRLRMRSFVRGAAGWHKRTIRWRWKLLPGWQAQNGCKAIVPSHYHWWNKCWIFGRGSHSKASMNGFRSI